LEYLNNIEEDISSKSCEDLNNLSMNKIIKKNFFSRLTLNRDPLNDQ